MTDRLDYDGATVTRAEYSDDCADDRDEVFGERFRNEAPEDWPT